MAFEWVSERNYEDILYETYNGIAKITINRPEVRNAFRPKTVMELIDAFAYARDDSKVGVIVLTGAGEKAFCSGGDQRVRGHGGYVGEDEIPRLNVLGPSAFNPCDPETCHCDGCWLCHRRRTCPSCRM